MDLELSDEQRLLADSLKAFVDSELMPFEAVTDRAGEVSPELGRQIVDKALALGFYAANLPESVGGGGLDNASLAIMERELGKVTHALHGYVWRPTELLLACEGDQIERYLTPCVRGEKTECFAVTEPGAGSDILSMSTRATQKGGDWIVNGSKHFISSHVLPDFAIVFAITGEDETDRGPRKRITAFLADRGQQGFDIQRGPRSVSQRAYPTYVLSFNDCRLGAGQVLGREGQGLELADKWIKMGRVWVGANCCGRAERLLELSVDWAATRKQFGQSIGRFQGTSFKLADMVTELQAADLLVMHAARKADAGTMAPADAAMAKLYASEMLQRVADNAVQIFGGMGLMEEMPIERLWRDSRLDRIWEGTSEIQRHIISRHVLRQRDG
ncbi:acyl-CoA/acyl-ACP dehydrogenase [Gammaproteobacteria bacterium]|nr:acyl-CoA/acyl-ACP dehydrogenase [Gammaproteobacteria bacterium]